MEKVYAIYKSIPSWKNPGYSKFQCSKSVSGWGLGPHTHAAIAHALPNPEKNL